MAKYKSFQVRGTTRYMLDGRLISKDKVPPHIIKNLSGKPDINTNEPEPIVDKKCIFCGVETKFSRFINLKTIALCEEHVYSKTTGEVIHKYNTLKGAPDEEEKEVQRQDANALQSADVQKDDEKVLSDS